MLVDGNMSLHILQPEHPRHQTALNAVRALARRGEELYIVPQDLVEVWAVATRPVQAQNGLGLSTEAATAALRRLQFLFTVLAETETTYGVWEVLVIKHRVSGKATHDVRLVATMRVHGLTSVFPFNTSDFVRYSGIQVVHPADVVAGHTGR